MIKARTVSVALTACLLLAAGAARGQAEKSKADYAPPKILGKSVTDALDAVIKDMTGKLDALDKEFRKRKQAPSTWLTQASLLRTHWGQYMYTVNVVLKRTKPGKPAGTLKRGVLDPWSDKYDRFLKVIVITPGGYAVSWKYNMDQMIAHWQGIQTNQPNIFRKLIEEAIHIQAQYQWLKRYADGLSAASLVTGMAEYVKKKREAQTLLTVTRNLMTTVKNKKERLEKLFKDEEPTKYHKPINTLLRKSWSDASLAEHSVPPAWIDTVDDWWKVCIERMVEYEKEYAKAKAACAPILQGKIFADVALFKGLYFSNLDQKVLALKKQIDDASR